MRQGIRRHLLTSPYRTRILITETADSRGRLYDVEGNLKEMFAPSPASIDTRGCLGCRSSKGTSSLVPPPEFLIPKIPSGVSARREPLCFRLEGPPSSFIRLGMLFTFDQQA
jgi:hypothetical protein